MPIQTTYPTAPVAAFSGQLNGGTDHTIIAMKNAEASASIPFGYAVCFLRTSPTSDQDAVLPGSETTLAGIVVHDHEHAPTVTLKDGTVSGDLDSTGLVFGSSLTVLRKGQIWIATPTACVPGDRLYVRKDAGEAGEHVGTCENASDESDMIDATAMGQWLTTAAAGGLALLEVDFTNS